MEKLLALGAPGSFGSHSNTRSSFVAQHRDQKLIFILVMCVWILLISFPNQIVISWRAGSMSYQLFISTSSIQNSVSTQWWLRWREEGRKKAGTGKGSESLRVSALLQGLVLGVSGFSVLRGRIQALTGSQWFFPGSQPRSAAQGPSERFLERSHRGKLRSDHPGHWKPSSSQWWKMAKRFISLCWKASCSFFWLLHPKAKKWYETTFKNLSQCSPLFTKSGS